MRDVITFSNTVNSADSTNRNLTVTTGGNTVHINFDGIVGGSQGLGAIAIYWSFRFKCSN